jgi:hypothetical protein
MAEEYRERSDSIPVGVVYTGRSAIAVDAFGRVGAKDYNRLFINALRKLLVDGSCHIANMLVFKMKSYIFAAVLTMRATY